VVVCFGHIKKLRKLSGLLVKIQPELLPPFTPLVPAYQISAGVAVDELTVKKSTFSSALPVLTIDHVPGDDNVTTLPAVPVTDHVPTVVVVPLAKLIVCATVFVDAISVKVLLPEMVRVLDPVAPPIVSFPYVMPPPAKVRALLVVFDKIIFALAISAIVVPDCPVKTVPVLVQFMLAPAPNVSALVPLAFIVNIGVVIE